MASIDELTILSNLESLNSVLIKNGIAKRDRFRILLETATEQRKTLDGTDFMRSVKKLSDTTYIDHRKEK